MTFELCDKCVQRRRKLCPACSERVTRERVPQSWVDVLRAAHMLKPEFKALGNVRILQVFDAGDVTFVVVPEEHGGKIIGKDGRVIKALAELTRRRLRVIELGKDEHKLVQSVIAPVELRGVNVVFTPKGEKLRVRVAQKELVKLPMKAEEAAETISMLTGKAAEIVGEKDETGSN